MDYFILLYINFLFWNTKLVFANLLTMQDLKLDNIHVSLSIVNSTLMYPDIRLSKLQKHGEDMILAMDANDTQSSTSSIDFQRNTSTLSIGSGVVDIYSTLLVEEPVQNSTSEPDVLVSDMETRPSEALTTLNDNDTLLTNEVIIQKDAQLLETNKHEFGAVGNRSSIPLETRNMSSPRMELAPYLVKLYGNITKKSYDHERGNIINTNETILANISDPTEVFSMGNSTNGNITDDMEVVNSSIAHRGIQGTIEPVSSSNHSISEYHFEQFPITETITTSATPLEINNKIQESNRVPNSNAPIRILSKISSKEKLDKAMNGLVWSAFGPNDILESRKTPVVLGSDLGNSHPDEIQLENLLGGEIFWGASDENKINDKSCAKT